MPADIKRDLAAVDHHFFNGFVGVDAVVEFGCLAVQQRDQAVGHIVEPAAIGRIGGAGHHHGALQSAEPAGVPAAAHAEHSLADLDDVEFALIGADQRVVGVLAGILSGVGHRMSPFISDVGAAASAASSRSACSTSALLPSLVFWTLSCSLYTASISISGRGGQPGRYMSTGTTWSTPCTMA